MCALYPTIKPELGMTAFINNYANNVFIMADEGRLLSPPDVHQKREMFPSCGLHAV